MKEAMVAPVERFFVNMTNFRVGNIEELLPNPVLCCDSLAVRYFWVLLYNLIKLGLQSPLRRLRQFWNLGECNEFVEFNTGCLLIVGVCVCNKRKLQTIQREKFKHY